jgi:glycyl-tRNA synthetase beta chain
MAEFLLELFSEEIPARMQAAAAEQLRTAITARLTAERLDFARAEAYVTPRRLTLVVDGLPEHQPDVVEERKGPHTAAPQRALDGFMKSAGLQTLEGCEIRTVGGADYYYLSRTIAGRATAEVLRDEVIATIETFAWPKSMRWGSGTLRWVRPLQNILCLFGGAVVDVALRSHDLRANDATFGHRFHAPQRIAVTSFDDYARKLRAAYVVLDARERRSIIAERGAALARAEGLVVAADPALLDEVTGLVEWPVPLIGSIDQRFMDVPREVLTTTMRVNQKYFALQTPDGGLAARFIVVANIEAKDGGAAIVAGNERVLRARLSDAKFFWEHDLQTPLRDRVPKLHELVFHAELGTIGDKAERLQSLAPNFAYAQGDAPRAALEEQAKRAGLLCKADLVTGMVREFPELQGVMGRYYAEHDGEAEAVSRAIEEHYAPLGPSDRCPTAPVSVAVALADKIDTLVGFFAIDERPTGSRDPYALRRAALGVIRLIVENGLRVHLLDAFAIAAQTYGRQQPALKERMDAFDARSLLDFIADRLKVQQRERGVPHDLISAAFSVGDEDDLVRLLQRVTALSSFLDSPDGANLLTAYKRAANIVGREERKDGVTYAGAARAELAEQDEERVLFERLDAATEKIAALTAGEDFAGAMRVLAELRPAVDAFFDKVTVNADEPELRRNRLRLLSGIRSVLNSVADFSKIER